MTFIWLSIGIYIYIFQWVGVKPGGHRYATKSISAFIYPMTRSEPRSPYARLLWNPFDIRDKEAAHRWSRCTLYGICEVYSRAYSMWSARSWRASNVNRSLHVTGNTDLYHQAHHELAIYIYLELLVELATLTPLWRYAKITVTVSDRTCDITPLRNYAVRRHIKPL